MKSLLVVLLCGLLAGCATRSPAPPKPPVLLSQDEADIYEAVFRHQFEQNASGAQQSAGTYFVQIQGSDPPEEFLRRFAGQAPPVKRGSEACHAGDSSIYDRQTGKRSLMFKAGKIGRIGKNTAEVEGGYYEGNLSASGNTYRLVRHGSRWKVIADTMSWISDARAAAFCYGASET